jgi:hypothetical protein
MHKLRPALLVALLLSLTPAAHSQRFPRAEIFGGFSYLSFDTQGLGLQGLGLTNRLNMYGWDASVTGNPVKWFGIEGDFSGHYHANCFGKPGLTCKHLSFMGGPKLAYRTRVATVYGHGLFGGDNGSFSFSGLSGSDTPFSFAAGGGVDFRVGKHLSLRPVQFDYFMTRHFTAAIAKARQDNYRFSAGLVFTFGERDETIPRAQTAPQSYPAPARQTYSTGTPATDAPLLGVSGYPSEDGFNVTAIVPGSPADTQVHMEERDIIVSVDGQPVHTAQDIEQAIAKSQTGTVRITYLIKGSFGNARDVKVR